MPLLTFPSYIVTCQLGEFGRGELGMWGFALCFPGLQEGHPGRLCAQGKRHIPEGTREGLHLPSGASDQAAGDPL